MEAPPRKRRQSWPRDSCSMKRGESTQAPAAARHSAGNSCPPTKLMPRLPHAHRHNLKRTLVAGHGDEPPHCTNVSHADGVVSRTLRHCGSPAAVRNTKPRAGGRAAPAHRMAGRGGCGRGGPRGRRCTRLASRAPCCPGICECTHMNPGGCSMQGGRRTGKAAAWPKRRPQLPAAIPPLTAVRPLQRGRSSRWSPGRCRRPGRRR
jgi:hypothetical protein